MTTVVPQVSCWYKGKEWPLKRQPSIKGQGKDKRRVVYSHIIALTGWITDSFIQWKECMERNPEYRSAPSIKKVFLRLVLAWKKNRDKFYSGHKYSLFLYRERISQINIWIPQVRDEGRKEIKRVYPYYMIVLSSQQLSNHFWREKTNHIAFINHPLTVGITLGCIFLLYLWNMLFKLLAQDSHLLQTAHFILLQTNTISSLAALQKEQLLFNWIIFLKKSRVLY